MSSDDHSSTTTTTLYCGCINIRWKTKCKYSCTPFLLLLFQVANKFIEQCAKSISDVVQRLRLPWEVTTCGWSSDEEEERVIRSRVIALLKMFVPQYWTKWERFKKKYSER